MLGVLRCSGTSVFYRPMRKDDLPSKHPIFKLRRSNSNLLLRESH